MKTTSLILAAALAASAGAHAAPWRMFQCTGTQGESVYSDRWTGTECREMWVDPERHAKAGTLITVGRVNTAAATPSVTQPGEL